jgi:hypothetical protein
LLAYQASLSESHSLAAGEQPRLRQQLRLRWLSSRSHFPSDQASAKSKDLSSFREVIKLDVSRSLHMHKDRVPHDRLEAFLLTYAGLHPRTGYCQGMNYLAGYALICMQGD